jgi:hypothetical protein
MVPRPERAATLVTPIQIGLLHELGSLHDGPKMQMA